MFITLLSIAMVCVERAECIIKLCFSFLLIYFGSENLTVIVQIRPLYSGSGGIPGGDQVRKFFSDTRNFFLKLVSFFETRKQT